MNQHRQKMQKISTSMEQWMQSNLASLGIYECSYGYYNLQHKQWMSMPTVYSCYCAYLEKGFTTQIKDRFHEGLIPWANSEPLYTEYQKHLQEQGLVTGYKFDLVKKIDEGFEMLTFGTYKTIAFEDYQRLYQGLHDLSYQAYQITKEAPYILDSFDIHTPNIMPRLHKNSSQSWPLYEHFKFGALILTGKELQLIQQLLSLMTYEEIACSQSITTHEIEQSFYRIKQKIKDPHITNSELFIELRRNYVLMSHLKDFI